jgi:hypothetical protein
MSGARIARDSQNNLYFSTGNGTVDTTFDQNGFPISGDYGQAVIKMVPDPTTGPAHPGKNGWGLKVVDYFIPFNQAKFSIADLDVASGGVTILPDSVGSTAHPHLLVIAGKNKMLYLIDRDNMGHFNPTADHVVQEMSLPTAEFGSAAYLAGTFYYGLVTAPVEAFSIANGAFNPAPTSKTPDTFSYPGSTPIISANGSTNRIVWALDRATNQLRAYDARNLAGELYTSGQAPNGRDRLGPPAKFSVPIVANGMVYAATLNGTLVGFGLLHGTAGAVQGAANSLSPQTLEAIGLGASLSLGSGSFSTSPGSAANAIGPRGLPRGDEPNGADLSPQGEDHSLAPSLDLLYTNPLATGESGIGGIPGFVSHASDGANDWIELQGDALSAFAQARRR